MSTSLTAPLRRLRESRTGHPARNAPWQIALAIGVIGIAAYLLAPSETQDWLYVLFEPIAGLTILTTVLLTRPPRALAWSLLGLGLLTSGAGDAAWAVLDANGEELFPSVADGFYLGGYALMLTSAWLLFGRGGRRGDSATLIDAAILAIGAALVIWVFFMDPIVDDGGMDAFSTGVALAYPAIDVAIIGLLARLLLGTGGRTRAFEFVVLGWIAVLASDLVYASQVLLETYEGGLIDTGWLAGYVLFAVGALHPSRQRLVRPAGERFSRFRLALLGAASLMAPIMALVQYQWSGEVDLGLVVVGSASLFLLVLVRMAGVNESLSRTLREREALELELTRQALHDPLTGLANRTLFAQRLDAALKADPGRAAVLFIDLDDFKTVNDTLGHSMGDRLLREAAVRVEASVRSSGLVARLGGDEFAVLVAPCDGPGPAVAVAQRILDVLREPFALAEHPVRVHASIGVACGERPGGGDELMRDADIAMYLAKGQGKDRAEVFQPAMHGAMLRELGRSSVRGLAAG